MDELLLHAKGLVQAVDGDIFWSRMKFIVAENSSNGDDELWKMCSSKLAEAEKPWIKEGAIFELKVFDGSFTLEFNKKLWTQEEINKAHEDAKQHYWLLENNE